MESDITERIRDWPSRSIEAAHEGLRKLADGNFSGAVDIENTWVFLLNGKIVGIRDGTLDDIAETSGTAYQAPGEALPLLIAMQTGPDADPRAQYYTEETSLEDVDETLSSGGFTGYLELSENVLSGDYYLVYHGGRSRAIAVVGTREEVILGEEAFQLAADEVGIYEVIEAPISITEVPSAPDPTGPVAASSGGSTDDQEDQPGAEPGTEESTAEDTESDGAKGGGEPTTQTSIQQEPDDTDGVEGESIAPTDSGEASGEAPHDEDSPATSSADTEPPSSENGQFDSTTDGDTDSDSPTEDPGDATQGRHVENETVETTGRVPDEEVAVNDRTEERDRLRERIDELESALDSPDDQVDAVERQDRSWAETVGDTSLFVRYDSRSDTTLEDVRDGVERESLVANLVLDYHTNFDDSTVAIDGVPFEDALRSSPEWSFLSWLVRDLPFEIRDTGRAGELTPLYDALPLIDRIELRGAVKRGSGEDGSGGTVEYDLICRDKTGNPLVVADIHEGRDPVGGQAVENIIERTSGVVTDHESLTAAYVVSPSFFRPEALESAQSATSRGMLSRDNRLSYVKLDRKTGFHLWLVEARNDDYHVTVPEL